MKSEWNNLERLVRAPLFHTARDSGEMELVQEKLEKFATDPNYSGQCSPPRLQKLAKCLRSAWTLEEVAALTKEPADAVKPKEKEKALEGSKKKDRAIVIDKKIPQSFVAINT